MNGFGESNSTPHKSRKRKMKGAKQDSPFNTHSFIINPVGITLTPSKSETSSPIISVKDSYFEIDESQVQKNFDFPLELDEEETSTNTSFGYNKSVVDEFMSDGVGVGAAVVTSNSPESFNDDLEEIKSNLDISEEEEEYSDSKDSQPDIETPVIQEEPKILKPKAQYAPLKDGILVVLSDNETIYFHGLMSIVRVLHGEIEVLGYKINKDSSSHNLYSPRGTSLLYIKNITKSTVNLGNILDGFNTKEKIQTTANSAIFICKKLLEPSLTYIEKHISQQILPKNENNNLPRVTFEPYGNWNWTQTNPQWDHLLFRMTPQSKMLICGGKGVGKSVFLRYAINKLLLNYPQVRVIDLDPGQSEFTPPGCISVVSIKEPIFGPNFTHLLKAEK